MGAGLASGVEGAHVDRVREAQKGDREEGYERLVYVDDVDTLHAEPCVLETLDGREPVKPTAAVAG